MAAIARATAAYEVAIAGLIDAAYRHCIPIVGRTPRPMRDDHGARIARGEHFICLNGASLVGVTTLKSKHPDAQGRGLLRELLVFAEQQARARTLGWLTLYTNVAMVKNRSIYGHLGFVELGEQDSDGYRIVLMQRAVPAGLPIESIKVVHSRKG